MTEGSGAGHQLFEFFESSANFQAIAGEVYFFGDQYSSSSGSGAWVSDGTASGTFQLNNVNSATRFTGVGSTVFFSAVSGNQLWKTDGTATGTSLVKNVGLGSVPDLASVNGQLLFRGSNAANGAELWRSDGTTGGTVLVKDINPGTGSSTPDNFFVFKNALYFSANDGTNGIELWKSDGTSAGTFMLKNIANGFAHSQPQNFITIGDAFYFVANTASHSALWKSDGTSAGTVEVFSGIGIDASYFTNLDGTLLFQSGADGELWKSDGTTAGTVLFKNISTSLQSGSPHNEDYNRDPGDQHFAVLNGIAYFAAHDATHPFELWRSDGTNAGTFALTSFNVAGLDIYNITVVGQSLEFETNNGALYLATPRGATIDLMQLASNITYGAGIAVLES